jgi:hypothetical protein
MNNSISTTLSNRTVHSSFLTNQKLNISTGVRNAQASSFRNSNSEERSSVMEKRMSVVNLEAGLSVQNKYSSTKVSEMSLAYRFGQASRSRISSSLLGSATVLNNLTYLR